LYLPPNKGNWLNQVTFDEPQRVEVGGVNITQAKASTRVAHMYVMDVGRCDINNINRNMALQI